MWILAVFATGVMMSAGVRDEELAEDSQTRQFVQARDTAIGGLVLNDQDMAHSSIYQYLSKAEVVEESADKRSSSPQNLTVKANGDELKWDKETRPGRVNPTRLRISIRWVEFLSVNVSKLMIQVSDNKHKELCIGELVDGVDQLNRKLGDELERLEDGLAVACHNLPSNAELSLHVEVQHAGKIDIRQSWLVKTADASSGDAQGWIMFLPPGYNASELHGPLARYAIQKEVTIFDVDDIDRPPMDIRVNGFEVDTSGDLREALGSINQLVLGSTADPMTEIYNIDTQQRQLAECAVLDQTALDSWVQAAKKHLEGTMEPVKLPCDANWIDMEEGAIFLNFGQDCIQSYHKDLNPRSNKYEMYCDEKVKPEHLASKTLQLPAKVQVAGPPQIVRQPLPRPQLALMGNFLAIGYPQHREHIQNMLATEDQVVGNKLVKLADPEGAKDAIAIIMDSAAAVEKLVETMERRSTQWWKDKTKKSDADLRSACFSVVYRHTRGQNTNGALPVAHVDAVHISEWFKPGGPFPPAMLRRVEGLLGMPIKQALKHVVMTFNEWINAGPKSIVELPLAIMDTTTLDEKDLDLGWQQPGLDSMGVRWSEAHRWYYRNLQPGDGYMFITNPHDGPEHSHSGTPHSAFRFVRSKLAAEAPWPRQSFEFRCLVVDENWTGRKTEFEPYVPKAPTQKQIDASGAKSVMTGILTSAQIFMKGLEEEDLIEPPSDDDMS